MATTTTPATVTSENSPISVIIGVVTLIAIVALLYFIARGTATKEAAPPNPPAQQQPLQQEGAPR